jgi:hypothetical protein
VQQQCHNSAAGVGEACVSLDLFECLQGHGDDDGDGDGDGDGVTE